MAKTILTASTMLLICTYITTSGANSNMVSITHRSSLNGMSNNYSSGLNIVKSSTSDTHTNSYSDCITNNDDNDDAPEEYVTNFYRQKRLEKRELAAKTVARSNGGGSHLRSAADHSLDHYFDHHDAIVRKSGHLDDNVNDGNIGSGDGGDGKKRAFFRRSNISSGGSNYDDDGIKNKRPAFLPNSKQQHARVASSVRGGSMTQHVRSKHSNNDHYGSKNNKGSHHQSRKNHQQQRHSRHPSSSSSATLFAPYRRRHSHHPHYQRHDRTLEESDIYEFNSDHDTDDLEEEYDEHDDYSSNHHDQQEADEGNSTPPHQAGLLRVPCSLRLNSSENTNHYHHSHSTTTTNNKSTPIAAYVDTGAQVTVISAAAARKVGILHLMDRRYAGRATGVGQCRILGRIPAGCVHFMLGQREDDDHHEDYDDDYDDYEEEERSILQMNGPALTVLEGTVTEGVDMLLGLDVLQDWEATIQMGGNARQSSITVKKRGMSEPVVLPFLVGDSSSGKDRRRRSGGSSGGAATTSTHHGQQQHQSRRNPKYQQRHAAPKTNYQHDHDDRRQQQRHIHHDIAKDDEVDEEEDLFSPFSSDIESDLDILDQSEFTHEFPDEGRRRVKQCSEKIVHDIEREDELLGVRHSQHYLRKERDSDNDDDDDFLQDSSDEEEEEVTFDMSGL